MYEQEAAKGNRTGLKCGLPPCAILDTVPAPVPPPTTPTPPPTPPPPLHPPKVVVTGAGGRTGGLIMDKLLARPGQYEAVAVVRAPKSGKRFQGEGAAVVTVDVAAPGAQAALQAALEGASALVIATSAVPKIKPLSIVKSVIGKIMGKQVRPEFTWKGGQTPEQVDWVGQKLQIDAAKAAGVTRVVIISSMGVTQPDNFLNTCAKQQGGGRGGGEGESWG